MDPQTKDILEAAIYSAGVVGSMYVLARNWRLKKKSDNETQPQKMEAYTKLIESEAHIDLLQKRRELSDSLRREAIDGDIQLTTDDFNKIIDATYGKMPEIKI